MSRNHPAPNAYVGQGDTSPAVTETLTDGAGAAVVLTGASVKFQMWLPGAATAKVDAAATIVDPLEGEVSYTWVAGNTDTHGDYLIQWKVTFSGGAIERFPNGKDRWLRVKQYVAA